MKSESKNIILLSFSICLLPFSTYGRDHQSFIYNGFKGAGLQIDGTTFIHPNGLLQLNNITKQLSAHAFHPNPINFNHSFSFSTTFAFAIYPEVPAISAPGILFVISPSIDFSHGFAGKYFGLFNSSSVGLSSNHVFAVELDTIQDLEFKDIDCNHVGIDVNSLQSYASVSAGYFSDIEGRNKSLNLISAKPMQIWVDYDSKDMIVEVTMAPLGVSRPSRALLSTHVDLSEVFFDSMYVGFSTSTGSLASTHYILGWSFSKDGKTHNLDLSTLPPLPKLPKAKRQLRVDSTILLIIISVMLVTLVLVLYLIRRKKFEEVLEDWEQEYLLPRFSYKDLYIATKGFKDSELVGSGGFGKVYRGVLPSLGIHVAVKRISHDSKQGMREFVSEVATMRRLRHRNLVQILGYCRRKGELLLVYDYMPNGSLDEFLFKHTRSSLPWSIRLNIIKGVASALLYLHEEWEQVVLHRDVKASNVLLDAEMNPRLGDFGLAKLYDRGGNSQSTRVVGTIGYIAPELSITGKPTRSTDVFAFGMFVLEVCCGRQPFSLLDAEDFILADWVFECWKKGAILETCDPKLEGKYIPKEIELVLTLGLLCTHYKPESRPSMRQVVRFLRGDVTCPDIPQDYDHQRSDLFTGSWRMSSAFPLTFKVSHDNFFSDI